MKKIGLFYSFKTKNTSKVADKIFKAFNKKDIEKIDVDTITEDQFLAYDNMILGVPTWWDGELPTYWDEFMPAVEDLKMDGKTVAIFGLGDQKNYPENFADGIGLMAHVLKKRGAKIVGFTSSEGYEFEKSAAIEDGKFLGLALDQHNQGPLTNDRIVKWIEQLKKEFK
jgi:flavodoxin I